MKLLAQNRVRAESIIKKMRKSRTGFAEPAVLRIIYHHGKNPFLILIGCLLSLRAKDLVSLPVSLVLFKIAQTPQELLAVSRLELEKVLRPIGFYRQKARTLHAVSTELIERFEGQVPRTEQELLSLPGVGRKTANLVLGQAFSIPAICVDIHVHRISNRLGLVQTKSPEETEHMLAQLLPQKEWIEYNNLLVMWGQNICTPLSPYCSRCPVANLCDTVGVRKKR